MTLKLLAAAALAASILTAGSAAAQAEGTYFIYNNGSMPVRLSEHSFSRHGTGRFPLNIAHGASDFGEVWQTTTGNVYVGTFIYRNEFDIGCSFTTVAIRSSRTRRYTFSFSAQPQPQGAATVCSHTRISANPTTGVYSANATMSGF